MNTYAGDEFSRSCLICICYVAVHCGKKQQSSFARETLQSYSQKKKRHKWDKEGLEFRPTAYKKSTLL